MERKRFIGKVVEKKASVSALFKGWGDWKEGDYVVGRYHSMYETEFRKKMQPNWRIEVLDCNFKIETKEGKMISPIGQIMVLNSAGQLNKVMEKTEIGMIVDLTYGGKRAGKDDPDTLYHTFTEIQSGYAPGEGPQDTTPESDEKYASDDVDF